MQPRSMLRASGLLALAYVAMFSQPRRAEAQEIKRFFAPLIADPKQPHLRAPSASGAYKGGSPLNQQRLYFVFCPLPQLPHVGQYRTISLIFLA